MEITNEIYKPVIGYEELYEVSDMGNVRHIKYNRLLSPIKTSNGYYQVGLSKNGVIKRAMIHRLVAITFIGGSDKIVDHINHVRTDNRLSNLRYATRSENTKYAVVYRSKNTKKKSHVFEGGFFLKQKDLAEYLGISAHKLCILLKPVNIVDIRNHI